MLVYRALGKLIWPVIWLGCNEWVQGFFLVFFFKVFESWTGNPCGRNLLCIIDVFFWLTQVSVLLAFTSCVEHVWQWDQRMSFRRHYGEADDEMWICLVKSPSPFFCAPVCAHMCVCVRACVRACVCMCVCAVMACEKYNIMIIFYFRGLMYSFLLLL